MHTNFIDEEWFAQNPEYILSPCYGAKDAIEKAINNRGGHSTRESGNVIGESCLCVSLFVSTIIVQRGIAAAFCDI